MNVTLKNVEAHRRGAQRSGVSCWRLTPAYGRVRSPQVRPADVQVRPADVQVRPADVQVRPADVRVRPTDGWVRPRGRQQIKKYDPKPKAESQ